MSFWYSLCILNPKCLMSRWPRHLLVTRLRYLSCLPLHWMLIGILNGEKNPTFLTLLTSCICSCHQSTLLQAVISNRCTSHAFWCLILILMPSLNPISFKFQNITWIQTTSHTYNYRFNISEVSLWPLQTVCLCLCLPLPRVEEFLLVLLNSWHLTDLLKTLTWVP